MRYPIINEQLDTTNDILRGIISVMAWREMPCAWISIKIINLYHKLSKCCQ